MSLGLIIQEWMNLVHGMKMFTEFNAVTESKKLRH